MIAVLTRHIEIDEVTFGTLSLPWCNVTCKTLELPWRDNQPSVSCIPDGVYSLSPVYSRTFGHILAVQGVPGRSLIRVHAGNRARDTHGCILTGKSLGRVQGEPFIFNSRDALRVVVSNVQAVYDSGDDCQLEVCHDF